MYIVSSTSLSTKMGTFSPILFEKWNIVCLTHCHLWDCIKRHLCCVVMHVYIFKVFQSQVGSSPNPGYAIKLTTDQYILGEPEARNEAGLILSPGERGMGCAKDGIEGGRGLLEAGYGVSCDQILLSANIVSHAWNYPRLSGKFRWEWKVDKIATPPGVFSQMCKLVGSVWMG